jgi:hypothetical protein
MATESVAVKIFPMKEKLSWMMEQDIYKLPHMKHEHVLRFIAAERRDTKLLQAVKSDFNRTFLLLKSL